MSMTKEEKKAIIQSLEDNYTLDNLLSLMYLVKDQGWYLKNETASSGRIRNKAGKCPICALVCFLIDDESMHDLNAHYAMESLLFEEYASETYFEIYTEPYSEITDDFIRVADNRMKEEFKGARDSLLKTFNLKETIV